MGRHGHRVLLAGLTALLLLSACGRRAPGTEEAADGPEASVTTAATTTTTIAPTTTAVPIAGEIYVVKPGDTLGKIATAYGVTPDDLASLNAIENPNRIQVGDPISLPPGATSTSTTPTTAAPPPSEEGSDTTSGLAEPATTVAPADPGGAETG